MPNYVVRAGRRLAASCHVYESGEIVTLPKEQGDGLVEIGLVDPASQARAQHEIKTEESNVEEEPKPVTRRKRRSGWTADGEED